MPTSLQDRLDALTHKLLHQQGKVVPINAADIIAGTFGSNVGNGNFIFPAAVDFTTITRHKGSGLVPGANRFWDGLELAHSANTPYIDFHRSTNPEEATDYNMRIINDADNYLRVYGGRLEVSGGALNDTLSVVGSGCNIKLGDRATANFWALYSLNDIFRFWKGGDLATVGQDYITTSNARIGYGGFYGDFACFAHTSRWAAGQYCLLQEGNGTTYLNSAAGTSIYLRSNNTTIAQVDVNGVHLQSGISRLTMNDGLIRTRSWNDDWHVHGWWSGNDGLRITEYGGLYFRTSGQDPAFEIFAAGATQSQRFDQIGNYDTACLRGRSGGGGSGCKIGLWSAGQNAAHILKCWGSTIEVRTWDDGGWGTLNGVLNNMSSVRYKDNVKRINEKRGRNELRARHKRIQPIHYNRQYGSPGCPNCLSEGKRHHNLTGYEYQGKDRPANTIQIDCPDCNGTGHKGLEAHQTKQEQDGWFGFSAEELAVEFPETVFYRTDEDGVVRPSGIDSLALSAVLWDRVQDLEDRLSSMEKK